MDSATGVIAQLLDYDSFGNVTLDTNPGFQPFGFQSGLYDADTTLVQFGARWYDAKAATPVAQISNLVQKVPECFCTISVGMQT